MVRGLRSAMRWGMGVSIAAVVVVPVGPRPTASAAPPSRPVAAPAVERPSPARPDPCAAPVDELLAVETVGGRASNSRRYATPSREARAALDRTLRAVSDARWDEARAAAARASYQLCAADDVVVVTPADGGAYARIALRVGPARELVVEAPHPFHDVRTRPEATQLFERLALRAVVVSGSYRCADLRRAALPGRTRVCGGHGPFATSDMAHNPDTFFQRAHVALLAAHPEAVAVSLHGMGGAGISVSDGTKLPTFSDAPVHRLAVELRQVFGDTRVTTCNPTPKGDVPVAYRLCGTTNAQGRATNGNDHASYAEPAQSRARFVHLEQSRSVRSDPERVGRALEAWLDAAVP